MRLSKYPRLVHHWITMTGRPKTPAFGRHFKAMRQAAALAFVA
jgi:hypothetical protein